VDRVVHPPAALLHADGTPLVLRNSPHTETPIRQTTREHDQHECRWNSRRLLPRRGGGSWGGAWRPRAGGRRACMRRRKGVELRFCHRRNGNEQRSDRGEGGIASTCTRRCRRSTSRSTGSDPCPPPPLLDQLFCRARKPKNSIENPNATGKIARRSEQTTIDWGKFRGGGGSREIEGFVGERQRTNLGAQRSGGCGCGVGGEPKRGERGARGRRMGSVFKRKQRGATVGTEMDGRDRATPVGQLVVAGRTNRRRGLGSRSNRGSERENVRAKGGSFEF
jgi:hypothetical protein